MHGPFAWGQDYMHDLGPEPGPPGGSSDSVFCPVRLGVWLEDFLVEPMVHLLSDTILMPNTYHAIALGTRRLSV